jgi:hypothetical protein
MAVVRYSEVTFSVFGAEPPSGTIITLGGFEQTTDEDGTARFSEVHTGEYVYTVYRDGFSNVVDDVLLMLQKCFRGQSYTIHCHRYRVVTNLSGELVLGATVGLDTMRRITGDDGRFTFNNVSFGSHFVNVWNPGCPPYSATIDVDETPFIYDIVLNCGGEVFFNPPRNLQALNRLHNRIALYWEAPNPVAQFLQATMSGSGIWSARMFSLVLSRIIRHAS